MNAPALTARVTLHGFPDLGLGGGNRPTLELGLPAGGLTGRTVLLALLDRFGAPVEPVLGRARDVTCGVTSIHLFANDKAIDDIDETLDAGVDGQGRIDILLILVRPIAGG
jgi:hypothetical protein